MIFNGTIKRDNSFGFSFPSYPNSTCLTGDEDNLILIFLTEPGAEGRGLGSPVS